MRTNNRKAKNLIISVYFILVVLCIMLATVFSLFSELTASPTLTFLIVVVAFVVLFFIVQAISRYFEYDSDGLKVVVINKDLLMYNNGNYREKQIEFYKEDLVSYKLRDYLFFKTLTIVHKNSKGHKKKDVFNVTMVSSKKRKYIRQSLRKMINQNKSKVVE